MSKINVAGDAIVVTSALKLDDIKLVAKYRNKELTLMGGEDNKDPIFNVASCEGAGSINTYGASFGSANADGFAQLTMIVKDGFGEKNPAEYIADEIGGALAHLNALEAKLPKVVEEIKAERKAVMDSVSVAC